MFRRPVIYGPVGRRIIGRIVNHTRQKPIGHRSLLNNTKQSNVAEDGTF